MKSVVQTPRSLPFALPSEQSQVSGALQNLAPELREHVFSFIPLQSTASFGRIARASKRLYLDSRPFRNAALVAVGSTKLAAIENPEARLKIFLGLLPSLVPGELQVAAPYRKATALRLLDNALINFSGNHQREALSAFIDSLPHLPEADRSGVMVQMAMMLNELDSHEIRVPCLHLLVAKIDLMPEKAGTRMGTQIARMMLGRPDEPGAAELKASLLQLADTRQSGRAFQIRMIFLAPALRMAQFPDWLDKCMSGSKRKGAMLLELLGWIRHFPAPDRTQPLQLLIRSCRNLAPKQATTVLLKTAGLGIHDKGAEDCASDALTIMRTLPEEGRIRLLQYHVLNLVMRRKEIPVAACANLFSLYQSLDQTARVATFHSLCSLIKVLPPEGAALDWALEEAFDEAQVQTGESRFRILQLLAALLAELKGGTDRDALLTRLVASLPTLDHQRQALFLAALVDKLGSPLDSTPAARERAHEIWGALALAIGGQEALDAPGMLCEMIARSGLLPTPQDEFQMSHSAFLIALKLPAADRSAVLSRIMSRLHRFEEEDRGPLFDLILVEADRLPQKEAAAVLQALAGAVLGIPHPRLRIEGLLVRLAGLADQDQAALFCALIPLQSGLSQSNAVRLTKKLMRALGQLAPPYRAEAAIEIARSLPSFVPPVLGVKPMAGLMAAVRELPDHEKTRIGQAFLSGRVFRWSDAESEAAFTYAMLLSRAIPAAESIPLLVELVLAAEQFDQGWGSYAAQIRSELVSPLPEALQAVFQTQYALAAAAHTASASRRQDATSASGND